MSKCFNCGQGLRDDIEDCPKCGANPSTAVKELAKSNNKNSPQHKADEDIFELWADHFIKEYPCYYNEHKILFCYNKIQNKWLRSDERDLINISKNILNTQGLNQSKIRSSFLNAILDKARWNKPKEVPKHVIQFNNQFYDLNLNITIPVSRKFFSQIKVPHSIVEKPNLIFKKEGETGLETPIIDKLITEWVGENQFKLFCQICAYCMYKDYPFARFFIFYGTGQDGKSKAGEFISRLVGIENTCNVDIDNLTSNRFESQKLYQKTLAICGEVDYKLLKNTRKLKGVTGSDPMTIEFKNKDPFTYYNFAKLIWYANGIPPTYDTTEGFYRRTIILKFPNKFKEKTGVLDKIPDEEYDKFCTKLIPILKDLLVNCFDEKTIKEKQKEYETLSNPISKFVSECLEITKNDDSFISGTELFKNYSIYSNKNNFRNFDYSTFITLLSNELDEEFITKKLYKTSDGSLYLSTKDFDSSITPFTRTNNKIIKGYCIKKESCPFVPNVPPLSTQQIHEGILSENPWDVRDIGTKQEIFDYIKKNPLDNGEFIDNNFNKELVNLMLIQGDLVQNKIGTYKVN